MEITPDITQYLLIPASVSLWATTDGKDVICHAWEPRVNYLVIHSKRKYSAKVQKHLCSEVLTPLAIDVSNSRSLGSVDLGFNRRHTNHHHPVCCHPAPDVA